VVAATKPAVLVMAKAPIPGRVKTRLEPVFTRAECAAIQARLIRRTAAWAVEEAAPGAAYVAFDPPEARDLMASLVPPEAKLVEQRGGGLGERLHVAAQQAHERHGERPLIVVGVDTRLTRAHAHGALERLRSGSDVVFGPALDGGYYLVALARPAPELFAIEPSAWGGPDVLERSLAAAAAAGLEAALLDRRERDLDTPADAEGLQGSDPELGELLRDGLRRPLVSIVVPTLDEAAALPAALDHLAALDGRFDVIVADGGSADRTTQLAASHPLAPRVLQQRGGRAAQMNAAAAEARGDPIVFLHADTRLPPDAYRSLAGTNADGGNFAIRFDGGDLFSRVLGAWYRAQRRLGAYYGDSAIWVRRGAFEALGGFRELPIMEDYDLARRLERGFSSACLPGPVVTSSRRWRALGVPRTVLSWVVIRWLFLAGVPPERLARLYKRVR
jgi:rSAM/selenodomain-associated transferase 2/rSAM/selenodomain-associated transferase 1